MRCYDESIEVRGSDGPAEFLWRDRLWVVRAVQQRWTETGPWWLGSRARAVRGEPEDAPPGSDVDVAGDLVTEEEVWRVVAATGRLGREGVYELAHVVSGAPDRRGTWRLRGVMD